MVPSLTHQKSYEIIDREGCHFWYQRYVNIDVRHLMKPEKEGCVAKQGPRLEIIFSLKYLAWKISIDVFGKLNYSAI